MRSNWFRIAGAKIVPHDRQVIIRSGDTIRYFAIAAWVQLSIGALIVLLVGATALTTTAWLGGSADETALRGQMLAAQGARDDLLVGLNNSRENAVALTSALTSKDDQIAHHQRDAASLREEISVMSARFTGLRSQLSEQARNARELIGGGAIADPAGIAEPLNDLASLMEGIERLQADRVRLAEERNHHAALVRQMEAQLPSLAPGWGQVREELAEMRGELNAARAINEEAERRGAQQQQNLALARAELDEQMRARALTERDLAAIDSLLQEVSRDRSTILVERDQMAASLDLLERRFALLADDQSSILARLGERTADTMDSVERTVAMTGLDLDLIIGRLNVTDQPQGGPYIGAEFLNEPVEEIDGRIAGLESQIDRLEQVQQILAVLPLAPPMDNAWTTSGFGRRRDPLGGGWAVHHGVDLAARSRSPIYATSPGRVTFVGWKGGYGKVVELDHGLGVRTRYGHLSKIFVKRDQLVDFREQVGLLGNTGRSTGEHLHYEVLVDDRAYDPGNFLRAGKYVFKH